MRLYISPSTDIASTILIFIAFILLTNMKARNAWEVQLTFSFFETVLMAIITLDVIFSLIVAIINA